MTIKSKHRLKQLFEDTSKLPSSKFNELIDAVWNPNILYNECRLSEDALNKAIDPEEFDERYVYAHNSFSEESSFSSGIGFGNSFEADFSQIYGFHNTTNSFMELVFGSFSQPKENQNPNEWIPTDILYVLANGQNKNTRSNAIEVYKSGLMKLFNAIVVSRFHHQNGEISGIPENGTIEYTEEAGFTGYHNGQSIPLHPELDSFWKTGEIELGPGLQTVEFEKPFTGPYTVMVEGRLPTEIVICRVINTDDFAFFTVNVRKACLLVWQAIKK